MNPKDYQKQAQRTNPDNYDPIIARISNPVIVGLNHAAMGMATEAGEFMDQLKKHIYYGKDLDEQNLKEEVGDLLWYCALACHYLDYGLDWAMEHNIAKLRQRFPDKFTKERAIHRDTQLEMKVFNQKPDNL